MRLGVVNFLNAIPLWDALRDQPGVEIVPAMPSELAKMLRDGEIDAGLLPVIEYFRNPETKLLAGPCVAADGPVESVLLFHRKALNEIESVALDANSRTSNALTQVLMAQAWGITPEVTLPENAISKLEDAHSDALVMIGDPAMIAAQHAEGWQVIDLAEAWQKWTGLPFVFAGWVIRSGADVQREMLDDALRTGLTRRTEFAEDFATRLESEASELERYLTDVIRYSWDADLAEAVTSFGGKAAELGLCPQRSMDFLE